MKRGLKSHFGLLGLVIGAGVYEWYHRRNG